MLNEVRKFQRFPSIATIRSEIEGGSWTLSEAERLKLFKLVIPEVSAVDIELSAKSIIKEVVQTAHKHKKLAVISYHNFDGTPSLKILEDTMKKAISSGADIVKVATLAIKREDVQLLAEFTLRNRSKNLVSIAMGTEGSISRILFPSLGSLMTYASLGQSTAPGQLDYESTFDLLRRMYPKYNEEKITSLKLIENY